MSTRRIGLMSPAPGIPGEVQDVIAEASEPLALWQVLTEPVDHSLDALAAAAATESLVAGVARMRRWHPDVVVWACTSGSFALGREGSLAQLDAIEAACDVPATSTSLAFVEALAALGFDRVASVAPYPEGTSAAFATFLEQWGIRVERSVALGCDGPAVSGRLDATAVERAIASLDCGLPVLLPDTAVWGLEIRRELENSAGPPLIVANQVTLWHAFDLAGVSTDLPAFGELRGMRAPGATRSALSGARG